MNSEEEIPLNRREFVAGVAAVGVVSTLPGLAYSESVNETAPLPTAAMKPHSQKLRGRFLVNGATHELEIDPRETVLDLVRERLDLTGSKKGCDHGQCGACTVLVEGKRVNSCLCLAAQYQNKKITTIEGLADGDNLHPMQEAFIKHDAFQCGFCTPGQIVSAVGFASEKCAAGKKLEDSQIRECMSGNICRCGAYRNIVSAIQEVQQNQPSEGKHHATV